MLSTNQDLLLCKTLGSQLNTVGQRLHGQIMVSMLVLSFATSKFDMLAHWQKSEKKSIAFTI
jgi:hypothetical protein